MADAEAGRRVVDVDLDRVDDADQEDADVGLAAGPHPTGPGVVSRTDFISSIQSGWRSMSETTSQTSSMGAPIVIAIFMTGSGPSPRATRLADPAVDAKAPPTPARPRAARVRRRIRSLRSVRQPRRGGGARPGRLHLGQRPVAVAGGDLNRPDGVDEDVGLVAERERVEDRRPDAVVRREAADDDPPDAAAPQEPVQLGGHGRAGQRVAHREAGVAVLAVAPLRTDGPASATSPGWSSAPHVPPTQWTGQVPPSLAKWGVAAGCQSWV